MSAKRVIIVDVMHLCYKAAFGGMPALTASVIMNGEYVTIPTTIPSFVIKRIFEWSKGGYYPTVVCFDSQGGNISRNAYFAQFKTQDNDAKSYKGGRRGEDNLFYEGCNITARLMNQAGICCLKGNRYEADDLIKAAVDLAKKQYPDMPIDIITGDADLVPLVDEQVSVFLSSRKTTYAVSEDIEKRHYFQLTPDTYQEYMESLTNYKNLVVPYNTVLLTKLLRGDKSDGIDGYPKFTPTKYKNLIWDMIQDGVDFEDTFRYDAPTEVICYRDTEEPVPLELISSTPKENLMIKYGEPPALTRICEVLSEYLDDDIINHVRRVYNGINLNMAYTNVPPEVRRRPAKITVDIKGFDGHKLQEVIASLRINLPTKYL